MIYNRICNVIGWVCLLLSTHLFAQDPVFSNYTTHAELLNPAFVGAQGGGMAYAVYRHQYPSLPATYETVSVGATYFDPDLRSGFGLNILHDDSADGLYQTFSVEGQYAYHLAFNEGRYLGIGVTLGYGRHEIDAERFIFPDQLDPIFGPVSPGGLPYPTDELTPTSPTQDYLDIGAGLLYYSEVFYGGIAFHHLNNPANDFFQSPDGNNAVDGLPLRYTLHVGASIVISEQARKPLVSLHPRVFYTRQRSFSQVHVLTSVRYKTVDLGLGGRLSNSTTDALLLNVGFSTNDRLRLYYAYDVTISSLADRGGGAHEVGLSYQFITPRKRVKCFDFFR